MSADSPIPSQATPEPKLSTSNEPLFSEYADDPDMCELVEIFVSELSDRASSIEKAIKENDRPTLAKLSHQLKGAAGGYGFTPITEAALEVENLVRAETSFQDMQNQIEQLLDLCRRATCKPKP